MQSTRDFFRETATSFFATTGRFVNDVLASADDFTEIHYTVFEQDSPLDNTGIPVEYFTEIPLDKTKVLFETLQSTRLHDKYGSKPVTFNFLAILSPLQVTTDGVIEKKYPFPNIGKCYKVVFSFISADPEIPDFTYQEIGYAV
ncbi:MAG: hypothetical protein LBQ54_02230 [Planctomycetaceae bacterium]|jgi:hypothetical protein|nr:hypothetical protein [Planctomycetaceae bacterium]